MSLPGEIAALASIVEPDVAVITNAGLAHAGGVGGTVDDVAREKGALFAGVRPGGVCVANADDAAVVTQLGRTAVGARAILFGRGRAAYRLIERTALGLDGSRVRVERPGDTVSVTLPIPGMAAAIDFAAALAAADAAAGRPVDVGEAFSAFGSLAAHTERERGSRTLEESGPERERGSRMLEESGPERERGSRTLEESGPERERGTPLAGRMRVRRARDIVVIDDAYNANPASMRAALATLAESGAARRVAVLGEMKELGPLAEREHAALGDAAADAGVALLVSCGGMADLVARRAAARGVEVILARDVAEAARAARERVLAGDVVLVKASRSVGAEQVVDALTREEGR
jgi:UDP-N-acetylmuramoyl-tripeptide--D-alanyl-D-alanine ligase